MLVDGEECPLLFAMGSCNVILVIVERVRREFKGLWFTDSPHAVNMLGQKCAFFAVISADVSNARDCSAARASIARDWEARPGKECVQRLWNERCWHLGCHAWEKL